MGACAARIATSGENGYISTIVRAQADRYRVTYDKVSLEKVANSKREFPGEWIASNRVDVTDSFVNWAMPLIGGDLPQVTGFKKITAPRVIGKFS